jgi:signal transduction histidine kinase
MNAITTLKNGSFMRDWANEFTDAELDTARGGGCMGRSQAYRIPNRGWKSVPTVTLEELEEALERGRQSAVLEERNRLAGEIHDGLAQSLTAICMQLGVAKEELSSKGGDPLCNIQRAVELANFGLAEARRYAHNLAFGIVDESELVVALQRLVECSNVAGRLRCSFRSDKIPENILPPKVAHELLRIAQEAIHNAVRHANPTTISVSLHRVGNDLEFQIRDNGRGIPPAGLLSKKGFGLMNMRNRAKKVGASLEIRSEVGEGTAIAVRLPIKTQ